LTSMGICKVRAESVSRTAPSKKQWVLPSHLYPIHFYVRPGSCKICVTWGSGTFVGGEEEWMLQKCENASISVQQVCSCAAAWQEKGS
jgi:hypothetical protein